MSGKSNPIGIVIVILALLIGPPLISILLFGDGR